MTRLSDQLAEIARRKSALSARAAAHREALGVGFAGLRGPIGVLDHGLDAVRFLRAHPVLVAAAVAGLVAFRRRGLASTAGSLLAAWRVWRTLSALSARALS